MREEDDLHLDLRALSFRFVLGRSRSNKPAEVLDAYRRGGSGTVGGQPDLEREHLLTSPGSYTPFD